MPEDVKHQQHRCENLKSHTIFKRFLQILWTHFTKPLVWMKQSFTISGVQDINSAGYSHYVRFPDFVYSKIILPSLILVQQLVPQ
jgi:hypothetical protein